MDGIRTYSQTPLTMRTPNLRDALQDIALITCLRRYGVHTFTVPTVYYCSCCVAPCARGPLLSDLCVLCRAAADALAMESSNLRAGLPGCKPCLRA